MTFKKVLVNCTNKYLTNGIILYKISNNIITAKKNLWKYSEFVNTHATDSLKSVSFKVYVLIHIDQLVILYIIHKKFKLFLSNKNLIYNN